MRLRKIHGDLTVGRKVIYPGFSEDRYFVVAKLSASGQYAEIERGPSGVGHSWWVPVAALREPWGSEEPEQD